MSALERERQGIPAPKCRKRKSDAVDDPSDAPAPKKATTTTTARKGPTAGNTSSVFYAAYVFFEKLRVRDGKPKNKTREEMEARWGPGGFDTERDSSRGFFCAAGTAPVVDKYGRVSIVPTGGGRGRARGGWM
ncbi:calcineurin is a calcium-dependent [Colletotrichum kahawae]|uniref:Calcineurin is a calcium-dependent n=1 Tax=Colletotrichum kahawae TaxID=34407 RepID=A0AAD9YSE8_COLKA|nr:calcineurin is a calcium-dependent [Colletotrichum kahawae]